MELAGECERLRLSAAHALRWERRWLLVAVIMFVLLLLVLLQRYLKRSQACP